MYVLKIITVSALVVLSTGLTYPELVALKDCRSHDSCERSDSNITNAPSKELLTRNCKCDNQCPLYGDCCLDSDYHSEDTNNTKRSERYSCVSLQEYSDASTNYSDVFMKDTCPEDWEDSQVFSLCQKGTPESSVGQSDPMANLPVTSKESNITYANYYCAICNKDTTSLHMWDTGWACENTEDKQDIAKEYVLSNLVYKDDTWGVNVVSNGKEKFFSCTMYPVIPKKLPSIVRDCINMVQTCPSNWTDPVVEKTCRSYTSAVIVDNETIYKNIHCAMCNYIDINDTYCYSPTIIHLRNSRINPVNFDFTVLFDFADSSGSNIVGSVSTCDRTEIWDPFFRKCRSVVCAKPNQVYRWNRCVDESDLNATVSTEPSVTPSSIPTTTEDDKGSTGNINDPIIFPTENTSIIFPDDPLYPTATTNTVTPTHGSTITVTGTAVASNVSSEFLKCHKIFLLNEEFTVSENGTVHVHNYSRDYTPEEYQLQQGGIFICAPVIVQDKFSPVMAWLSLVGMGVSCICILLHLVAFLLVPDLRNLSGKNLASLCLALLASNITFIVNMFSDPNAVDCIVLAAFMYYFFLSSFCWMNATAFDIWNTFRLTKVELRVTAGNQWHKFIAYSLYSWLLPALAVIIVVIVDVERPEGIPNDFLPYLGERWCWFGHRKALLVFFALPMTILIVLNCVFFISTARIIAETTLATSNNTTSSHHKNRYKMHMRLAVLMGFTWLTGTLAGYVQLEALWYVFVLLNTLQGAFIFAAFTCRRKVWRVMGISSGKMLHRGASWMARRVGRSPQNMELKNTPTPSTSTDGF